MKKLAITVVGGLLAAAYGLLFISLIARAIDHGGWWILVGVLALLANHAVMRYQFARSKAAEGDAEFDKA
jgi:hypothetical protein